MNFSRRVLSGVRGRGERESERGLSAANDFTRVVVLSCVARVSVSPVIASLLSGHGRCRLSGRIRSSVAAAKAL